MNRRMRNKSINSETTEWRVYKINDSCFLAVPRYNDDNPPVILKTRE